MLQFFGHLHPVLVHLPIGILLLACLFIWQSRKDKYENLQRVIQIILFWGMISAIASCITGYILSQSGEYDDDLVNLHQWMGISVAVVSMLTYYSSKRKYFVKWQWMPASLLLILIFITGHLGGSLTHGSDYLTLPLKNLFGEDTIATIKRKPIANIQEAFVYADVIQPILQTKCYTCHGMQKQKGKFRMDRPELLMKGGKDGAMIIAGNANGSELIKRISLPREDEHHMAPKEKPQLTEQEIILLKWWIDNNADTLKKVKEILQPEKIKPLLTALQNVQEEKKNVPDIPSAPIERADDAAIQKLKELGVVIIPVSQSNNYLSANFVTATNISDKDISLLLPLKKQLVWLKLGNTNIGDSALAFIAQCINLTKLQLNNTNITDKGLEQLQSLTQLQSLNLTNTKITAQGIKSLKGLKQLQSLYLYKTNVDEKDWPELKKIFPKAIIDSGNYNVPLLETDTMIVKPPVIK
jgi:uncharacterized membrane protein